jgi:hypothetical protein
VYPLELVPTPAVKVIDDLNKPVVIVLVTIVAFP